MRRSGITATIGRKVKGPPFVAWESVQAVECEPALSIASTFANGASPSTPSFAVIRAEKTVEREHGRLQMLAATYKCI